MSSTEGTRSALQPGEVLQTGSHAFRIDSVIATGGFGVTYKATTIQTFRALGKEVRKGERVVVKECFNERCMRRLSDGMVALTQKKGEGMRRNFIAEAQLIHRCQGQFPPEERGSLRTGLVPVYHAGQIGSLSGTGVFYYVEPFIDGGTLDDYVGNLTVADVVVLLYRLLRALQRLHAMKDERGNSIVHGDIKPQNIMLTKDRLPVLIDFGGAVARVKTPAYAAPEQSDTKARITPAADLFSLAVTFHYILRGGKLPKSAEARIMSDGRDVFDVCPNLQLNEDRKLLSSFEALGRSLGLDRKWAERFLCAIDLSMSLKVSERPTLKSWLINVVPPGCERLLSRLHGGIVASISGTHTISGQSSSSRVNAAEMKKLAQLWDVDAPALGDRKIGTIHLQ